jgi:hypothetical protein
MNLSHALTKRGIPIKSGIPAHKLQERPFRRPDYFEEWTRLKTTWSLHRRGRTHLISERLQEASQMFYASEPLTGIDDWLWRFLLFFSRPAFEKPFMTAVERLKPILATK